MQKSTMHAPILPTALIIAQPATSLDAALVSPGKPTPFPSIENLPDLEQGMHFNLHNNVWGTNYVMWWPYQKGDETIRFRFVVQVEEVGTGGGVAEE